MDNLIIFALDRNISLNESDTYEDVLIKIENTGFEYEMDPLLPPDVTRHVLSFLPVSKLVHKNLALKDKELWNVLFDRDFKMVATDPYKAYKKKYREAREFDQKFWYRVMIKSIINFYEVDIYNESVYNRLTPF